MSQQCVSNDVIDSLTDDELSAIELDRPTTFVKRWCDRHGLSVATYHQHMRALFDRLRHELGYPTGD